MNVEFLKRQQQRQQLKQATLSDDLSDYEKGGNRRHG